MIHFLYIYCLGGLLTVWFCLEGGNYEAKKEGITFQQMHQKTIEEFSPESRHLYTIPNVFIAIFLVWFIILLSGIVKLIKIITKF